MERKYCWEVKNCGREAGGKLAIENDVCPAALPSEFDSSNKVKYGGRIYWAVADTLCQEEVHGTFARKLESCFDCEFLDRVHEEESRHFVLIPANIQQLSKLAG